MSEFSRNLVSEGVAIAGNPRKLALAIGENESGVTRIQRFYYGRSDFITVEDVVAIRAYVDRHKGPDTPKRSETENLSDEVAKHGRNVAAINDDETIVYPVAINGHGASLEGRHNEDEYAEARLPIQLVRTMMGGRVPRNGLWTVARGESMAPYIPNGHPVFIEKAHEFVDGGRYAVWLGSGTGDVIKRVEVGTGGSIVLRSDNRQVRTKTLYPTEDPELWEDGEGGTVRMVIHGEVIWPPDTAAAVFSQFLELNQRLKR